jgi:hypothetical protein
MSNDDRQVVEKYGNEETGVYLQVARTTKERGDFLRRRGGWKYFQGSADILYGSYDISPHSFGKWSYAPVREYQSETEEERMHDGEIIYIKPYQVTTAESELLCRLETEALLESGLFRLLGE